MADYYAAATDGSPAGNDGNSGTSPGSPWTLKKASETAAPGDTVHLRGGSYPTNATNTIEGVTNAVTSGSAGGGYITYQPYLAEVPILTQRVRLDDQSYLRVKGITFNTLSAATGAFVMTTGSVHHIVLDGCTLDIANAVGMSDAIQLLGTDHVIRNCKLKRWNDPADDTGRDQITVIDCTRVIIEDNDFSQAEAGHGCWEIEDSVQVVLRRNYFRNPVNRMGTVNKSQLGAQNNLIIEDNFIIDCLSEGLEPLKHADEVMKWQGERNILRNNLFLGNNQGRMLSNNAAIKINVRFGVVGDSFIEARKNRVYHNIIHMCGIHAVALSIVDGTPAGVDINDNQYLNNILSVIGPPANGQNWYGVKIDNPSAGEATTTAQWRTMWQTCRWLKNLFWNAGPGAPGALQKQIRILTESPTEYSVSESQGAGESGNPALGNAFQGNLNQTPIFADATDALFAQAEATPTAFSLADRVRFFDAYQLAPSSPGYQVARQLATVTGFAGSPNGNGLTTIDVDDALCFHALNFTIDGSVVTPDRIIIGLNNAVTIASRPSDTRLTLATPVNVAVGDKIYLERTGSTPSIGLFDAVPAPPPPPATSDIVWFEGLIFEGINNPQVPTGGQRIWFDGLVSAALFDAAAVESAGHPAMRRLQLSGILKMSRPGIGVT
jgi:hypothetical protein